MVIERVRRVAAVRSDTEATTSDLETSLADLRTIRAFCDASEADIVRRIATASSFPEATLAEASRDTLNSASKTMDRSRTLDEVPELADALDDAAITAAHIDALTRTAKGLQPEQRQRLFERVDNLVDVASEATVEQFARRIRTETRRITADDGIDRLERQRRATSMSTWTDPEGMWNIRGRFDPVTALSVSAALDRGVETLFAEATPDTCPSDPIEKQKHLRALAFAHIVNGDISRSRSGRPEFVAVIDIADNTRNPSAPNDRDTTDQATPGPDVTCPIPIEVPRAVLAEMTTDADIHTVVVRNGVVLHAPGNLNLGRTTRLANRTQRRALRGPYSTCAIPGCTVTYDRCKLHHITWWRHGGNTNLDNLLPVCSHHHHNIHDTGWTVTLDPDRRLTITFPDDTTRNTGPPHRNTA